jgi:NAD(P)-dependent dehydrogenase (short-subunit alcohol dehydrogenase family)
MKVFVAGASGALGVPLVKELLRQGHQVTAMGRSASGVQKLKSLGTDVAQVDALDAEGVCEAVQRSSPEAVIDQLTSLPNNLADLPKAAPRIARFGWSAEDTSSPLPSLQEQNDTFNSQAASTSNQKTVASPQNRTPFK